MKGFVKHLLMLSLALVLGWASTLFYVSEAETAWVQSSETESPYTLTDSDSHSYPVPSFEAIVPAERVAGIHTVRFPSSPVAERVGSHTAFSSAQQCCCQLITLREKLIRHDYEGYKAQLCSHGHYLYSLCQMLI